MQPENSHWQRHIRSERLVIGEHLGESGRHGGLLVVRRTDAGAGPGPFVTTVRGRDLKTLRNVCSKRSHESG
jgi:hypothetical protein